jgi:UDP-3-O-[3-hydroxymyristoyl] glucosamine N-acyltransferase
MKTYSITEINEVLQGVIVGETTEKITAPEQLDLAKET